MKNFKFPTAYTILIGLTIFMAGLTWIVPAGQYSMENSEALGKDVPIVGTYHSVEPNPQGFVDVLMAPIQGFYDPSTYEARAIDIALFVLVIGGFLALVTKSGAIDAGIARVMILLKGREHWMIPILMSLFAAGGTVYGMAEETIPFYALLIPIIIAAGYDTIVAVSIILIGAGIGCLGSTINPFSTVIASNAAGISFTEGIWLRVVMLVLGWLICTIYVMRYAKKVKEDPSTSLVASQEESNKSHFLKNGQDILDFTLTRKIILSLFVITFAIMIWGVSVGGWWMAELTALFLCSAITVGLIARFSEEEITSTFVDGARDLLGVAFIITIARGLVVIMDQGNITHTILFHHLPV